MSLFRRSTPLGIASSIVAIVATGCFGIGDIDRTQPEKVEKSTFFTANADGTRTPTEFYFRQTIIDVPATSNISFIGEQSETERVVFDVQEKFLFAYRSYGHLENDTAGGAVTGNQGDGYVRPGTGPYTGTPIAAFPILSHFDVQRQYNAQTGEQSNVITEDSSDRPWYDRKYLRVDWSNNLITDFKFAGATVAQAPITYNIPMNDPSHADTKDRAIVTPEYIDIVTKISAEPELNRLYSEYLGRPILECYLPTAVTQDCAGGTLKVRSSFRKVQPSDYVALDYDDLRFQKFGFFRTERYRYNDEYGVVEPSQVRLANRWNVWKDAASCYDKEADLPYSKCKPEQLRTIVYYFNEDMPEDLRGMAVANGEAWNKLMAEAVVASTGFTAEQMGDHKMVIMCPNNPVKEGDPSECGAPGLNPQIGDLRYSMYYYVPNQQASSPLGYGPAANDPLTGEIIQANAFYYGAAGAGIAARTRDIIKLQLGLLTDDAITGGTPATEAVANLKLRADQREALRAFDPNAIKQLTQKLQISQKADRLAAQIQSGVAMHDERQARLASLDRSSLDEYMMTDEIKDAFGVRLADGSGDLQTLASASRLVDPKLFELERTRRQKLLAPGVGGCLLMSEDVFDEGLVGLTATVTKLFYDVSDAGVATLKTGKTDKDVYDFILINTMGDTQLHEMGHTMGLRHNFSGSSDALNYGPKYWELRGLTMTGGNVRPKPQWEIVGAPLLNKQRIAMEQGLRDHQDSSIMDYASTYGTNVALGMYDRAAIKYAYGDVVEVFQGSNLTAERAKLLRAGEVHYTYYPEVVSDAATYKDRAAALYNRANINFRKTLKTAPQFDTNLREVPYSFCSDEYLDASSTCAVWDSGADNYERTKKAADDYRNYYIFDSFKRERLTFGVDIFSYLSRVYSRKMSYMLNQYKNWVNDELIIRRGRPCVTVENGQLTKEQGERYASNGCGLAGFLGTVETINLLGEIIQSPDTGCYQRLKPGCYNTVTSNRDSFTDPDVSLIDADPSACDTATVAQPPDGSTQRIALKVLATTPYTHVQSSTSCDGIQPLVVAGQALTEEPLNLPLGGARPANTTYDRDRYGYFFYNKPIVIGSWWDKWMAVKAFGDGNTNFIGVDSSSDTRSFLISLNLLFGDDINTLIGGLVNDNTAAYGPRVNAQRKDVEFLHVISTTTADPLSRDKNVAALVNPDQQYTLRLMAMFNAAFQGQATDTFEFGESLQVGSQYNVSDIEVPADRRADASFYAELTDPVTGLHWYAINQKHGGNPEFYSVGYNFIREIKSRYYVGGADGPGTDLLPGFTGSGDFAPRGDIRILNIMKSTMNTFGGSEVWSGDFNL